ncbi:MAG: DUF1150 family protein [Alphaproteobacteria bacterium]
MEAFDFLQYMSDQDMAILGLQDVAYVKPVVVDGQDAFSIHAADGTTIAIMADREVAVATIRQHDLEPVSVH